MSTTPSPKIEVNDAEQYRNLATFREDHGRGVVTIAIRTGLRGQPLEVAIAEMLNVATVVEFQVSEITKNQPWKIQAKHEQLQPRRSTITVNGKTIQKIIEQKRKAGADVVIPDPISSFPG